MRIGHPSSKKGLTMEQFYGVERATEIKKKIGEKTRLYKRTPEHIDKLVSGSLNARRNVEKSKEWNRKISVAKKGKSFSLEHKRAISVGTKIGMLKSNAGEKISKIQTGRKLSEETKDRMSIKRKKYLSNKENLEQHLKNTFFKAKIRPNKSEIKLYEIVNSSLPDEYILNWSRQLMIGGMFPDLVNINGKKKLIEFFGDYWHRNDNPQERINKFRKFGFDCLVIWEHELKDLNVLKDKLLKFNGDLL